MLQEADELIEYNNLDYNAIMEMTPFEFNLLRAIFINKAQKKNKSNNNNPNAPLDWEANRKK